MPCSAGYLWSYTDLKQRQVVLCIWADTACPNEPATHPCSGPTYAIDTWPKPAQHSLQLAGGLEGGTKTWRAE